MKYVLCHYVSALLRFWFQTDLGREKSASYSKIQARKTLTLVDFDSWGWQSFVSPCDVFNCLFPLDVQNEIKLLPRVFCYSWLVCLLGFWLRNASLVKVGNPISDGIVFVFHLAWCVRGLKSLKRFWPYLIVFSASRMVSLSNYCIWCLFFYI